MEIVPAILVRSFNELQEKLSFVSKISNVAHIDFCDGHFVKAQTWPYTYGGFEEDYHALNILDEKEGMPYWDTLDFEFDLMIKDPHLMMDRFLKLGAKKLIFHIESISNLNEFNEFLEGVDMYIKENLEIGIAINTTTDISLLKQFIPNIDFIQCMGIEHIGRQGEPFDERVFEQIKKIKKEYPEVLIAVDGGINMTTAPLLIELEISNLETRISDLQDEIDEFNVTHSIGG